MTGYPKENHVKVTWTDEKSGTVIAEVKSEIKSRIPPVLDDNRHFYTPEDLFVAAGAVCFMNSVVHFTKKMHIEFKSIDIESVGVVEQVGRSYEVTRIHTKTRLVIGDKDLKKKFERALELGAKYCFVANSMKCPTNHEHEIVIE
ncbi:MAG: OsmC family protein [Candidatus Thorarchaeota archaeon]